MRVFTVNINNTNTQFGTVQNNRLVERKSIPTNRLDNPERGIRQILHSVLKSNPKPDGLCYSSVVPKSTGLFKEAMHNVKWNLPALQLTYKNCPLQLNFPHPEEIGQDRLANAIAAEYLYQAPVVVIDMGTAVTFDIVSSRGYEGGLIAPGIDLMTRYLNEQTALLPKLDPDDLMVSAGIGKSTLEAMELGCVIGMEGMIRALLLRVRKELNRLGERNPTVITTGGSAGILPKTWLPDITFNPGIALIGLARAYQVLRV
jgi:type III pantothenate kinase